MPSGAVASRLENAGKKKTIFLGAKPRTPLHPMRKLTGPDHLAHWLSALAYSLNHCRSRPNHSTGERRDLRNPIHLTAWTGFSVGRFAPGRFGSIVSHPPGGQQLPRGAAAPTPLRKRAWLFQGHSLSRRSESERRTPVSWATVGAHLSGLSPAFQARFPAHAYPCNARVGAAGLSPRARTLAGAASMRRRAIVKRESRRKFQLRRTSDPASIRTRVASSFRRGAL